uniref:Zgc:101569 n=1 Tax=Cyprinus carpio carpio TaxID=630221 RepID=A0A8C1C6Y4_CYPCA
TFICKRALLLLINFSTNSRANCETLAIYHMIQLDDTPIKLSHFQCTSRFTRLTPLIAAVSGYAVAGGLELALSIIGVFCHRFGVPLIDGGTMRFPQLIGLASTKSHPHRSVMYLIRNGPILASSHLIVSLCAFVLALQVALELAEQVSTFPQLCLCAYCNSAYHAVFDSSSFTKAMQYEFDHGLPVVVAEAVTGGTKFTWERLKSGEFRVHSKTLNSLSCSSNHS